MSVLLATDDLDPLVQHQVLVHNLSGIEDLTPDQVLSSADQQVAHEQADHALVQMHPIGSAQPADGISLGPVAAESLAEQD